MLEELYKDVNARMEKTIETVVREFASVRTGKATPHLLDTVKVESYGTTMPISQVGTISAPEPRLLVVQAFDKSTVGDIVKGIQKADLGLNPVVDGSLIRIPVPALNEERRHDLVRHCKTLAEEGRVAIRNIRRDFNEQAKKLEKAKDISKDQEADAHDEIQKSTDDHVQQIDKLLVKKEKEVMEV